MRLHLTLSGNRLKTFGARLHTFGAVPYEGGDNRVRLGFSEIMHRFR
jgi:hypothetical protein